MLTLQDLLSGLPVIASLVIIEGLLSVDNVFGIAALAKELPHHQQRKAIRLGMAGAYVFRVLALLMAAWFIANTWVRWLGAGYLVWLMCSHLTRNAPHDEAQGNSKPIAPSLIGALLQIGLMDLSLSMDNVIAAVGLAPKDPLTQVPVMWPIYTGVLFAIVALQAIAPHAMRLLRRYPVLEPTAFILIGFVGFILIYEESYHVVTGAVLRIPSLVKFAGIVLIVSVAMLYATAAAARHLLDPLIRLAVPLMKAFAAVVNLLCLPIAALVNLLIVPVARLLGACRGKR